MTLMSQIFIELLSSNSDDVYTTTKKAGKLIGNPEMGKKDMKSESIISSRGKSKFVSRF